MPWPGITDFSEAVQSPLLCFKGTELEAGTVTVNQRGMPLVYSGAFASVYPVSVGGQTFAVRCFTREVKDQQTRYNHLSEYLINVLPPSFVHFEYVEHGINVKGTWYPIVRMEWVEGESLSSFVGSNLNDPDALRRVAREWRSGPAASLRGLGIAHNDLQHGNVMVQADGRIRLVDYDGMFLPRFGGERSPELGHRNYQHPLRTADDYDAYVDNFPALVIYLSLLAVASDPGLWQRFYNDDNLIFTRGDYAAPGSSELFDLLKMSQDQTVAKLAERLEECCALPAKDVPDLETILQAIPQRTTPTPASSAPSSPPPAPPGVAAQGYRQTLQAQQPAPAQPASTTSWRRPAAGASPGCAACGRGNRPSAARCAYCGASLLTSSSPPTASAPPSPGASSPIPAVSQSKPGAMKRVMLRVAITVGGVIAVLAAILALAVLVDGGEGASGGDGVSGGNGVGESSRQAPAITAGADPPAVTLNLSPPSIGENGGSSRITASLSGHSSVTTTVTVSAAPGAGADSGDYSLSGTTLTIAPLETTSGAALTISAVDNAVDAPDKTVHVSGGASNALGVKDPAAVALTIIDDDGAATVTLELSPPSIDENGGVAGVTAFLSSPSSQTVTVVVSASPVSPAVPGDFAISSNRILTIAAGQTSSTDTVTITGVDNDVDAPDKSVTVSAAVSGGLGVSAPSSRTLTITDDEGAPTVTLDLSPPSIGENGGAANVTASLSGLSSQSVTLTVSASPLSPAVGGDFAVSSNRTLTVPAGQTSSADAVTITGVDNDVDTPDKSVTVSAAVSGGDGVSAPSSRTLTITDDDGAPTVILTLSPPSISENGGSSTITASLSAPSSAMTTVTVSAALGGDTDPGDYSLSGTMLTIAPLETTSAVALTVSAIDNAVDAPDKTVFISGGASNALGVTDPAAVALTITDDDDVPTVTLGLSSPSIGENSGTASVTASLSGPSSEAVSVVISASPAPPAVSEDFAVSSNKTLTIAAGQISSTGKVTITGVDDGVDGPDKSVTISAAVSGGHGVSAPPSRTLTITDDDAPPTVTLDLSPTSISENGGTANVTASLSGASSKDVTLTVSASPTSPAVSSDFIPSSDTLTISAGSTRSAGAVTITGLDNDVDAPDKSVTISAAVSGGHGVRAPSSRTLTITDDDGTPTVTLALSTPSIAENGGSANVTASLSGPSSDAVTIVVTASPVSPAVSGDFTISSNDTLTIAVGQTSSTGTVTITGVDDGVDAPDRSVTVSATVSGGLGVSAPSSQTLTIADDEETPALILTLGSYSIVENGGSSMITASLSAPSYATTTVTVSAAPGDGADPGDYSLSGTTLTIAPLETASAAALTLSAVDNAVDAPDKTVHISGGASNALGVTDPTSVALTITDDDGMRTVTLHLTPSSISENGGTANVTASLSGASSEAVTVVVTASPVSPAVSGDFAVSPNNTLTIAPGSTMSTDVVTITGVDNGVDALDKSVAVSATVSGGHGVSAPSSRTLTITDDDSAPTVTLDLSPPSISENGGSANVTASLNGASSEGVTVVVSASPVSPAVSGDFTISPNKTLTIAAGQTSSTGAVTITGVDDGVHAPDKSVTVSATVSGGRGVSAPPSRTLTITDDDGAPTVTLNLSLPAIGENGGSAKVTASLSGPSSQVVTLTVSASPVSPAVSGDFTISSNDTLTIAAGATRSTGAVTITGVDDDVDAPDKSVTVSAAVSGGDGVSAPSSRTLTITDDDSAPTVRIDLSSPSISEKGGIAEVTASLSRPSSEAVTLTVSASPVSPAVSGDFTISSNDTLTIEAGSTKSTGKVTITGVDNDVDAPNKSITVSATVSGGRGVSAPSSRRLGIRDDDAVPTVTLYLSPSFISENGGVANVTASLSAPSFEAVTILVTASPVSPAVSGDVTISSNRTLTIAAGQTSSTGAVTITGVDNGEDAPDKFVLVWATVSGGRGVNAPSILTLTITDDE